MLKAREPGSVTEFVVNGTPVQITGDHPHLLSTLREELGVLSAKDGCSPSGQCGCCTVLVDGKAIVSCNLSLERVEGAEITTLEGSMRPARPHGPCLRATGAFQCGFCTPGIVVRVRVAREEGLGRRPRHRGPPPRRATAAGAPGT